MIGAFLADVTVGTAIGIGFGMVLGYTCGVICVRLATENAALPTVERRRVPREDGDPDIIDLAEYAERGTYHHYDQHGA